MKRTFAYLLGGMALFAACSSPDPESTTGQNDLSKCPLMLVDTSVKVTWTAYKTTEKIGVSGTFDTLLVKGAVKAETIAEVMQNISFEIPVSSVNSANPDRDKKIFKHFFSTMESTATITGKVLSVGPESTWKILLTMNLVTDTLDFEFDSQGSSVRIESVLNLAEWSALPSVDSLNQVCYDLHKAADGVSKLWPEVKLEITAAVVESCN